MTTSTDPSLDAAASGGPQPLAGLKVVLTGEVPGLTREQAQEAIVALGGKSVGSVSGATGLVIAGDGAGVSKMDKAIANAVPVLDAQQFLALLADPSCHPVGEPLGQVRTSTAGLVEVEQVSEAQQQARALELAHRGWICSATIDGAWTVFQYCKCGWKGRYGRLHEAQFAHTAHRAEHGLGEQERQ